MSFAHQRLQQSSVDDTFLLVEKPEGPGLLSARDRAILELLYSSGLRVSELSGLNVEDINTKEGLLKVKGKGKKERILPVGSKALDAIKSYSVEKIPLKRKDKALFLNRTGSRLTDRGIRRIVVKYARMIGISGRIGPPCFETHLCIPSPSRWRRPQSNTGTPGSLISFHNPEIYSS